MSAHDPAAPRREPPSEPRLLAGRYELGAVLGYGGMAVVRKATDLRLGRTVAVKMLRGELTDSVTFQGRFRREARAAAALNHPAIVGVYDAGEETVDDVDTFYIVMEYVEGHTLRDLVHAGALTPRRALEITADVLDALEESHRRGIVHRDVKPANVMVTPAGAVKVMDFGVARAVADMSAALTQTAVVIGTAQYLSPEQARGDSVDARSDVYSTGCLLHELLTGRPPFEGDSPVAVAYQHVREAPRPPSAVDPGVPPDLDAIVLAALAKQPDQRYQSAGQMRDAIAAVLAGEQAPVPPAPVETTADLPLVTDPVQPAGHDPQAADPDTSEPVVPGRPRRRARVAVAAAAALLVLGVGGLALNEVGDDPSGGQPAQRSARGDGGPAASRRAPTDTVEPAGATGGEPTSHDQRRGAGDARADDANDEDPRDTADRNTSSVDPTADEEPETSDTPTATSTAEPTPPPQTTPDAEQSESTPPDATTSSDPPTESPEPQPTTSEEPPSATPTDSEGGASIP